MCELSGSNSVYMCQMQFVIIVAVYTITTVTFGGNVHVFERPAHVSVESAPKTGELVYISDKHIHVHERPSTIRQT